MVSLYEILQVPPTATKDEIKKAYKSMALKTHPDRVPPEEKTRAEAAFQKINAAYEVLSNDAARREYDMTGQVPPSAALGTGSPDPSRNTWGQAPPFFGPFGSPPFSFGPESFFNDHFERFGTPFNHPFFNTGFPGGPFANDPFFNPRPGMRGPPRPAAFGSPAFPNQNLFREVEDMLQDFTRQTPSSAFGGRMHGNSLFDPPPFPPTFFRPLAQPNPRHSLPRAQNNNGRRFESSTFFSSSSTYKDGQWVSEAYEENNINGERRSRRGWVGDDGIQHVEEHNPDGSKRHLRNGVEQHSIMPPPSSHQTEPLIQDASSSYRRRRD